MKNIIIYHKNCLDGIFSAGVVYKFLNNASESVSFVPMDYTDGFDMNMLDKETILWIVDFSFSYDDMKIMNESAYKVYWYDHHISSESILFMKEELNNIEMVINIKHSGAYITWNELFSKEEVPKCILLVEDRDLWRFKYDETRHFTESLISYPKLSPNSDTVQNLLNKSNIEPYVREGVVLSRAKEKRIERAINKGFYGTIKGHNAFFVNASEDISEIGERIYLSNIDPIVAVIFNIEESIIRFSLRSNSINVEDIARSFSGGGHISAAGFSLNTKLSELRKVWG